MQVETKASLHDAHAATRFYDERYRQGYMERWPEEARRRIIEVLRSLGLPPQGAALDFGCGNGVLTELLRQTLPTGWRIYGSDLSAVAVQHATADYPGCTFFEPGSPELEGRRFDLVFTHHVLEHVHDLKAVAAKIAASVAPSGAMLHIMPCGNPGSLEYYVSSLRRGGIDPARGNRFFYEDVGHIRRLTSGQLTALFARHGFRVERAFFSNQHHGAIEWLTRSINYARRFTDPQAALGPAERDRLALLRRQLTFVAALRLPAHMFSLFAAKRRKRPRDYVLMAGAVPFYPFSWVVDKTIRARAAREWDTRKTHPDGSGMYLYFTRRTAP